MRWLGTVALMLLAGMMAWAGDWPQLPQNYPFPAGRSGAQGRLVPDPEAEQFGPTMRADVAGNDAMLASNRVGGCPGVL